MDSEFNLIRNYNHNCNAKRRRNLLSLQGTRLFDGVSSRFGFAKIKLRGPVKDNITSGLLRCRSQ